MRGALLLLIPLLLIVGLAFGAVGWYARKSYYVGYHDGQVVVFKGVPGGVLGWNPTVEQRSDLSIDDVDYVDQLALARRRGPRFARHGRAVPCRPGGSGRAEHDHHDDDDHDHHDAAARRRPRPPWRRPPASALRP